MASRAATEMLKTRDQNMTAWISGIIATEAFAGKLERLGLTRTNSVNFLTIEWE